MHGRYGMGLIRHVIAYKYRILVTSFYPYYLKKKDEEEEEKLLAEEEEEEHGFSVSGILTSKYMYP
jgi:hypothetical protein